MYLTVSRIVASVSLILSRRHGRRQTNDNTWRCSKTICGLLGKWLKKNGLGFSAAPKGIRTEKILCSFAPKWIRAALPSSSFATWHTLFSSCSPQTHSFVNRKYRVFEPSPHWRAIRGSNPHLQLGKKSKSLAKKIAKPRDYLVPQGSRYNLTSISPCKEKSHFPSP